MSEVEAARNGVGFVCLLTILSIGLKLTGYVAWSWFWVLSPIIFFILLWLTIFIGCLIIDFMMYNGR